MHAGITMQYLPGNLEFTSHLKWARILFCCVFSNMIWLHGALKFVWGFLSSPGDCLVRECLQGLQLDSHCLDLFFVDDVSLIAQLWRW
jgi:hypothetical protein